MLVKSRGIVFRTIKYSETSIITDIFTREKGLRSFIVNGVRKAKPKFSQSLFQIMSQVDILAYDNDRKNLNRIKEIQSDYNYVDLPFNVIKSSIGVFMTELCQKSIKEREANFELYDFLSDWFKYLDQCNHSISNIHLKFMIDFSSLLGFQPMNNFNEIEKPYFNLEEGYFTSNATEGKYIMSGHSSRIFHDLMNTELANIASVKLSRESRAGIIDQLIIFYKLHIENFPNLNSVSVLAEVLK